MKYLFTVLLFTVLLFAAQSVACQDVDWYRLTDNTKNDTLFVRFDEHSPYIPMLFNYTDSNGQSSNTFSRLASIKRDGSSIGVIYCPSGQCQSSGYNKYIISKDSLFFVNLGSVRRPMQAYGVESPVYQSILVNSSTVFTQWRDPRKSTMHYYTDDGQVFTYTCDTSQISTDRFSKWQRYPWPPPARVD